MAIRSDVPSCTSVTPVNVAISRAECLAYLVCSPRLLEVDCRTIDHMRLANALCRFVEVAKEVRPRE